MFDATPVFARAHRQDLMEEAHHQRLIHTHSTSQPGLADRALLAAGDLLIAIGQHLKNRSRPAAYEWAR